ncbi:MAG: nitroreductase family protein, partial [Verrucomicrobiota bacterium]
MDKFSPQQILDALNWRYATKVFDPAKKIPSDQWKALEESLVLTPSSFGLQPWEFVIVEDPETREDLVQHSWNQRQVADASHLLVIALRTDVDEAYVDHFVKRVEEVRGEPGFTGY